MQLRSDPPLHTVLSTKLSSQAVKSWNEPSNLWTSGSDFLTAVVSQDFPCWICNDQGELLTLWGSSFRNEKAWEATPLVLKKRLGQCPLPCCSAEWGPPAASQTGRSPSLLFLCPCCCCQQCRPYPLTFCPALQLLQPCPTLWAATVLVRSFQFPQAHTDEYLSVSSFLSPFYI